MRNKQHITKFIGALNGKNYHEANKYLQAVIESKIKAKIATAVKTTKLF
jgi:hypothetical protein